MQHYGLPIFGHEAKELARRVHFASLPRCASSSSAATAALVTDRSCTGLIVQSVVQRRNPGPRSIALQHGRLFLRVIVTDAAREPSATNRSFAA
jgi:hypothetical protein